MNRKDLKRQNIFQLFIVIANVLVLCYISSLIFFRIDLTQEKRFTISPVSKQILKSLPDEVLIKVYLEGDLPSGFKRLNKSIKEMLDEFRVYSGKNIQYQFIDPYSNPERKAVSALMQDLNKKGLRPTRIKMKDSKGGYSEKLIVPGALISYNGVELPLNLLSNNPGLSGEENLNNSVQGLEYGLINVINSVTKTSLDRIAFLEGQGELNQYHVLYVAKKLTYNYDIFRGSIGGNIHSLDSFKCVIIAKPKLAFTEEDKFVLDQYIMNGGKVLWLIDPVLVNEDSAVGGSILATVNSLNLDDQLFKYGIRINPSLIEDVYCSKIQLSESGPGSQNKLQLFSWPYYPIFFGNQTNIITKNIAPVKGQYVSYIDTLAANGKLEKKILLASSPQTKVVNVPALISFSEVDQTPQLSSFTLSNLPVAVLVEGKFPSVFKNRMLENLNISRNYQFKDESKFTKMIFVADGDIIKNEIYRSESGTKELPAGCSMFEAEMSENLAYGNSDFILNAVNYLTDEIGLMNLRSRQVILRLLDRTKIQDEYLKWKLINVLYPVLLILLSGIGYNFLRKKMNTT